MHMEGRLWWLSGCCSSGALGSIPSNCQLFTFTFTPITDFLLIEWSQCTWVSTFIKATAFHYSLFCYLDYPTQSLLVQKTDSALFEWHSCYWPRSYTVNPVHPNFYFYKTFSFTAQLVLLPRLPDIKFTPQTMTMIVGRILADYYGISNPRTHNMLSLVRLKLIWCNTYQFLKILDTSR